MIEPGTELADKYRVLRLVGEGGMGSVYEAVHALVGRRVAVKILHPQYSRNETALARFAREARAAGATGHEHIVEVLDFGTHHGTPFLVMEFLQGQTLAQRLSSDEPVPVEDACRIAGQLLSALAAAHAAGVVHRDLKPENVFLLARSSGRIHAKLVDFGVSKFQSGAESNRNVTEDGTMLGTPAYMSPEQWMGRRDVDHRADLFAVGILLYELLTGQFPYEGETRGELFLHVVQGTNTPDAPSTLRPGVPPGLDAVVLKAVERDRDHRFSSAQEFLAALAPYGAEGIEVVDAPPASIAPESMLPFRRSDPRTATRVDEVDAETAPAGEDLRDTAAARPSLRAPAQQATPSSAPSPRPSLRSAAPEDADALAMTMAAEPVSVAIRTSQPVVGGPSQRRMSVIAVGVAALGAMGVAAWGLRSAVSTPAAVATGRGPEVRPEARAVRAASDAPSASASATASVSAEPSAQRAMVSLELQGVDASATVSVNGTAHRERPLSVDRSEVAVQIVVRESDGTSRILEVTPNGDQLVVFPTVQRGAAVRRASATPTANAAGAFPPDRRF